MDYQERYVDNTLRTLQGKCIKGEYNPALFRRVLNGSKRHFKLDKMAWMRDYVNHDNQSIAAACIESLCTHGAKIGEFANLIEENLPRRQWCEKFIDIATWQKDPDVLLPFLEENSGYINNVIIALKRTKNETYLTTLLLSDNQFLANAVNRIVGK